MITRLLLTQGVNGENDCCEYLCTTSLLLNAMASLMHAFLVLICANGAGGEPNVNVIVHSHPWKTENSVSPGFVGLSIEFYNAHSMLKAPGMPQCLRNFYDLTSGDHEGPNLRIGGDSSDSSCWASETSLPQSNGRCDCSYNISSGDIDLYQSFHAKSPNVTFVLGTNFACSPTPTNVSIDFVRALSVSGMIDNGIVRALEVGNEIDKFPGRHRCVAPRMNTVTVCNAVLHCDSAQGWSAEQYASEFGAYAQAYEDAGLPPHKLQGAVFCNHNATFDASLPRYVQTYQRFIASISYHAYSLHGGSKPLLPPQFPLPSDTSSAFYHLQALLSEAATSGFARQYGGLSALPVPLVIGEGNTESGGGFANVSNTFASALWALDWLAAVSQQGAVAENLHGGRDECVRVCLGVR